MPSTGVIFLILVLFVIVTLLWGHVNLMAGRIQGAKKIFDEVLKAGEKTSDIHGDIKENEDNT